MHDSQYPYQIDPEFRDLIPPLSDEEYKELEQSILLEGCRDAIYTWRRYIVDGHNRYEICQKHNIVPVFKILPLRNREEVIVWICTTQLARRNISDHTKQYLIGKRYEVEKILGAHNANGINQHSKKVVRSQNETEPKYEPTSIRTREKLGKEYNVAPNTIQRYGEYSKAVDHIKEISPKTADKILDGNIPIAINDMVIFSKQPEKDIRSFCEKADIYPNHSIPALVVKEMLPSKKKAAKDTISLPSSYGAIKEMPSYDRDAEIKSLCLTLPSWVKSIDRAISSETISESSREAKDKLMSELINLNTSVEILIGILKGETE